MRLWVVGCSTGEEAYTLAILCRECLEDHDKSLDVKIFATDVDRDAIVQAGSGFYPESIAADLSPRLLNKYFFRRDDNFQVVRNIREMVVFAQHNLIKDPPFTSIDMISCRNLLIYLQPVLQTKVMELFNFSVIRVHRLLDEAAVNINVALLPEKFGRPSLVAFFLEEADTTDTKRHGREPAAYDIGRKAELHINDLENMYAGTKIGMLFLDENLDLRRFTPQISRIFKLMDSDIGWPFDHLTHRLADIPVGDFVQEVQETGKTMEKEVLSEQGTWYLMRILPYRVAPQTYSGVVLSFTGIHLLKTAQAALEAIRQEHNLAQHTTNIGTWGMNIETGACQWSDTMASLVGAGPSGLGPGFDDYLAAVHAKDREAEQIYGWRSAEAIGMSITRLIPTAHQKTYQDIIERIARGEAVDMFKTCRVTKSGGEIEVWLKATPILDRQGRPEAVAVTERVITP